MGIEFKKASAASPFTSYIQNLGYQQGIITSAVRTYGPVYANIYVTEAASVTELTLTATIKFGTPVIVCHFTCAAGKTPLQMATLIYNEINANTGTTEFSAYLNGTTVIVVTSNVLYDGTYMELEAGAVHNITYTYLNAGNNGYTIVIDNASPTQSEYDYSNIALMGKDFTCTGVVSDVQPDIAHPGQYIINLSCLLENVTGSDIPEIDDDLICRYNSIDVTHNLNSSDIYWIVSNEVTLGEFVERNYSSEKKIADDGTFTLNSFSVTESYYQSRIIVFKEN